MHRSRALTAVVLAVVAVAWLLRPPLPEGPILWSLSENHGLTAVDLPALAALAVAGWLLWSSRGR